jgi:hypothetical protein
MALAVFGGKARGVRNAVTGWSAKSRAHLVRTVASLDLHPLVSGDVPPAMVTLTLPGDWLAVAPTAEAAQLAFKRWVRAFERQWKVPLRCIWKREFQRRGAPHWHLWLVPPVPMGRLRDFRSWLSESWTRALQVPDSEERRKSLLAGTGLDFAEGLRARDPKRLAVYFLKESLGGEGKAYQNDPPAAWAGQSVGRYWGVRGIPVAVEAVHVDPVHAHRVWRVMRKAREASARTYVEVEKYDARTGRVYTIQRRQGRKVRARAGWVAVNDGAAFAERIARYLDLLAQDPRPEQEPEHREGEECEGDPRGVVVPAQPHETGPVRMVHG